MAKVILGSTRTEDCNRYKRELESWCEQRHEAADITVLNDFRTLLKWMEKRQELCDILYLDICFQEQSGVEIAERLRKQGYHGELIFLMEKGRNPIRQLQNIFDVQAAGCIIKGICDQKRREEVFVSALDRLRKRSEEQIVFVSKGKRRYITFSEILYFEVQNRIIAVYYGENKQFSFYSTMDQLEERLKGKGFVRIHRSYVVNIKKIAGSRKNEIQLVSGKKLPAGRVYLQKMKEQLEESCIA